NPDGSLDSTFGTGGKVQTTFISPSRNTLSYQEARAVAIQADGKIVVAGYTDVLPGKDWAFALYNRNGTLDTTFGGTKNKNGSISNAGEVVTDFFGNNDGAYAVAIQ